MCPRCHRDCVPDPVYAAMQGPASVMEYHRLFREWLRLGCIAFIMEQPPT